MNQSQLPGHVTSKLREQVVNAERTRPVSVTPPQPERKLWYCLPPFTYATVTAILKTLLTFHLPKH